MAEYEPTWDSLDQHETPTWFRDAKLGIFVHWGIYSVPGWASGEEGYDSSRSSEYAEWYPNYMYMDDSPFREYHLDRYGPEVDYIDFLEDWTADRWDPDAWADLFADVGAGYVVLVGEHHDGFPLWDCDYTEYNAARMGPERDIVSELEGAVREHPLRFAVSYHANHNYYQPGFDGPDGHPDFDEDGPGSEYVDFMNAKHRELIRKYHPDLLWFDLPKGDSDHLRDRELIADFYNQATARGQAVGVNDRSSYDAVGAVIDTDDEEWHGDFETPEYSVFDSIRETPWEAVRGIGRSFGYNRAEEDADHIAPGELIRSFVDVVSKNGNLLLNVGPRADGTIPEMQLKRLRELGDWLSIHRDAIVGSRPWVIAEEPDDGVDLRYTWRAETLYATMFEYPEDGERLLSVPDHVSLDGAPDGDLLAADGPRPVDTTRRGDGLGVTVPDRPDHEHAWTVALAGVPNPRT